MRFGSDALARLALLSFPAVACLRAPLGDPDLWWHLAAGEWIVAHRRVPWADPFSFTATGNEWIAYSWLAEVFLYALASGAGFAAIIILRAAAVVASVALLYLACRATGARTTIAVAVAGLAAVASSGAWSERPMVFTLLLLALVSWLLRRHRHRRWIAPAIAGALCVWANVHILFVVGLAVVGTSALAAARTDESGRLWKATLAATASTLVNPYGWYLHAHLAVIARQPAIAPWITEFQPPVPSAPYVVSAAVLVGIVLLAGLVSRRRPVPFESATFWIPLALGLFMARNVALFAVLAAPTAARLLEAACPRPAPRGEPRRLVRMAHAGLAVALVVAVIAALPREPGWRENIESGTFPVGAADYVARSHPRARIFNDFDSGGFLLFRLRPAEVSIDGRTQVYGERILADYSLAHFAGEGWHGVVARAAPDVIVWPKRTPLEQPLRDDPVWRLVFEDETSIVLVPGSAAR